MHASGNVIRVILLLLLLILLLQLGRLLLGGHAISFGRFFFFPSVEVAAGVWFHKTKTNRCHRREFPPSPCCCWVLFLTPVSSFVIVHRDPIKLKLLCTYTYCSLALPPARTILYIFPFNTIIHCNVSVCLALC